MKLIFIFSLMFFAFSSSVFCQSGRAPDYISPNSDGIRDVLSVPVKVTDKRYITSWALVITDANGKVVRTIENKISNDDKLTWKSFFKKLVSVKQGVDVPDAVVWNGAMDNGERAPDGEYKYYFTATDDNGNTSQTGLYTVIVDTKAPDIEVILPAERVFGEGARATLTIEQEGTDEDSWIGHIRDTEGNVVRTYEWHGTPPTFSWNGLGDDGKFVPDGVYSYDVTATDRAGNLSNPITVHNIIYTAERPATNIAISGSRYFSPATSSTKSNVTLDVTIPTPAQSSPNRLEAWSVEIVDDAKNVRRRYDNTQEANPPSKIVFDGKDANGNILPDGRYQARVTAKYLNGFETAPIYSPEFVLDRSVPQATARVSDAIFGGENKRTLSVSQKMQQKQYAPIESWNAAIYAANDTERKNPVRTYNFGTNPPESITWDGFATNGALSPNGSYVYEISATDAAGNTSKIASDVFTLDTSTAQILLSAKENAFSPNSDSIKETQVITPVLQAGIGGVSSYTLTISDGKKTVRKFTGANVPQNFTWNGQDDSGKLCPDGTYVATLDVQLANGSSASASTQSFALDTAAPKANISAAWNVFSPDGVSRHQSIPVSVSDCSTEALWTANVKNSAGTVVRHFDWTDGKIQTNGKNEFAWDGTDNAGNKVADGVYSIEVASEDAAGNKFSKTIPNIRLDAREVRAFITRDFDGISPNGDEMFETQKFNIRMTVPDGIATWKFEVCNENGTAIRTWEDDGNHKVPANIVWDGLDKNGVAGEGTFMGVLTASYDKGNDLRSVCAPFVCTATPPELSVRTAPKYFSPDNDGVDDDLFISLQSHTKAGIANWSFVIDDPNGNTFWHTEGRSQVTERITWDGLSNTQRGSDGLAERVQSAVDYPYTFTVTDTLGMTSSVKGVISVDVLVIRDGNKLKMAVPSIIFRSDSADFKVESAPGKRDGITIEQAANNERVLKRVTEVLNKFREYKVTIVGHANRTTENPAEETQDNPQWGRGLIPLSQERAAYVRDYLVKNGVARARLSTEGKGGTEPVADRQDRDQNWKNRRVEFILQK